MNKLIGHRVTELKSDDGTRLFAQRWEPAVGTRAEVVLLHGFSEHSGRYWRLADFLNRRGFAVSALDFRGHGKSDGLRSHVRHFDDYCSDLQALVDFLREGSGFTGPRFLLGHSHGGLVAARYLQSSPGHGFRGLVLSSPFFGFALKISPLKSMAAKILGGLYPTISFASDLAADSLSHDPEEVAKYETDPLVSHGATAGWYVHALRAQRKALERARSMRLPTQILAGAGDNVVSRSAIQRFAVSLGSEDKTLIVLPELRHELLNEREPDRTEVMECICSWMEGRLRGSGPEESQG